MEFLCPDAALLDDANCIVLITPGHRVTIANVESWKAGLDNAKGAQLARDAGSAEENSGPPWSGPQMLHQVAHHPNSC